MRVHAFLLAALAVGVCTAGDADAPPFNKDELEGILKKEHSQKVSNVYDSQNDIQCADSRSTNIFVLVAHTPAPLTIFSPQVHLEHRDAGAVRRCRWRVHQGRALRMPREY